MQERFVLRGHHIEGRDLGRQGEDTASGVLKDILQKEGIENPPHVHVSFDFGRHFNKGDAISLRGRLGNTDILLLEFAGWSSEIPSVFNGLVTGRLSFKQAAEKFSQFRPGDFIFETLRSIQGRANQIYVHPLDVTYDTPLFREIQSAKQKNLVWNPSALPLLVPAISYDEAITQFSTDIETYARLHRAREDVMLAEFPKIIAKALKERKNLKEKAELNVMAVYGDAHAPIRESLEQKYPDIGTTDLQARKPLHTALQDHISRSMREEDTAALREPAFHAYLAQMTLGKVGKKVKDGDAIAHYINTLVQVLTPLDWREFYRLYVVEKRYSEGHTFINEKVRAAGIPSCDDAKAIEHFYMLHGRGANMPK